jgi:hypothetical protein
MGRFEYRAKALHEILETSLVAPPEMAGLAQEPDQGFIECKVEVGVFMNRDFMMTLKPGSGITHPAGDALLLDLPAQFEPSPRPSWIKVEFCVEDKTLNAARDA